MSVGPTTDGAKVFRAMFVGFCITGALVCIVVAAIASWLGAW